MYRIVKLSITKELLNTLQTDLNVYDDSILGIVHYNMLITDLLQFCEDLNILH